ncbi:MULTISPECIES: copper chaperone PCu(A)C [Pseudomonas]|uniref:copper chaperone PCu(A)C n=1 Tax=Pseudomonas TaxID=286 RepID=UPI001F3A5DBB|nr:copper chaperone PCu(A)C [Pseudomonas tohonis]
MRPLLLPTSLPWKRHALAVLMLLAGAAAQAAELSLGDARAQPSDWDATAAVVVLDITDTGAQGDRLVGASTPRAWRVDLQTTVRIGEARRVMTLVSFGVPPGGVLKLAPMGSHLTLVGLKGALEDGERFPLTLRFARGGEVTIEVRAERPATKQAR